MIPPDYPIKVIFSGALQLADTVITVKKMLADVVPTYIHQ
jgi:hypothetical protein